MPTPRSWSDPAVSLAYQPAKSEQRRIVYAVTAFQFIACGSASLVPISTPQTNSFIPTILAIVFVTDLVTSVLLFIQSAATDSRALLVLANGYLFSALIVIPHALTFPGAFSPKGLLGAGTQSSGWLNFFWHFGFLAAVAGYVWLKDKGRGRNNIGGALPSASYWSVAFQIGVVCALTWAVTTGDSFMPRMFLDDRSPLPMLHYAAGTLVLLSLLVLLLLGIYGRSVLDLWLMVVIGMLISEMTLVTFGLTTRFSLGWYVSRGLAVSFSTVVLIVLLVESSRLYATLSRAYVTLKRERNNKLISVKAATSSISHEIRQPLAAITANASAARTWLEKTPPAVAELKPVLDSINSDCVRAAEVLENLPTMFDASDYDQELIDVNQLAVETVQILRGEMNDHGVKTAVELAPELSPVMGHRIQLQQAILNLFQNAIEASASVEIERRILKVRTRRDGDRALIIEVEDSGPGIEKESLPRVFEAFVTTKPNGTGLGLAISKRIAQLHGGRLNASSDGKNGALFQLVLPVAAIDEFADQAERRNPKIKRDEGHGARLRH